MSRLLTAIILITTVCPLPTALGDAPPRLRPDDAGLRAQRDEAPRLRGGKMFSLNPANRLEWNPPASLLERSVILSYGGYWTFVPKEAILAVPPTFSKRIANAPTGTLIPWPQFYARNRGWIHPQRVTLTEARGEAPLAEAVVELHRSLGRVVVAVLHGGPISVLPCPESSSNTPSSHTQKK